MINLIGNTIDHYQILVKIRETPTRVLYRAYNIKAQNYTALEVIKTAGSQPSELLRLINDQVHKNAVLTHPNIAAIIDTGSYEGLIYIVYNFSPAHPLRRFFNRTYRWHEMARELVSITNALAYAHEKEIIHGALHPSSIVLDERRNPILFDFGFEQIISDHLLAHTPGAWINRWGFEYRAPEQLNGAPTDWRSDIYALGMMLHEWLIGKIPLLDATILGTLQMRTTTTNIKATKETTLIPAIVQDLIQKCVALNPDDRYQSMQEVYIILARGALDMSITKKMVRKPLDIPMQRRFTLKRLPVRRVMGIVATLAALSVFVFMITKIPARSPDVTSTATPYKTQAIPTHTATEVNSIATSIEEEIATELPLPEAIAFPVFQETPISSVIDKTITKDNINQMSMLSLWGIGDVNRLVSAPDGKYIAVASSIGIFIFDAQSLKLEKYIDTRSWIIAIDFSPDSKIIATGDRDGLIQLWDTNTWQESGTPLSGHTRSILDLAFSSDGTKLASVALDNTLIEWEVSSTGSQKMAQEEVIGGVTTVAYSADGTRIITGGNDFQIKVWSTDNLTVLKTKAFSGKIVDIASIKESSLFVIGGSDQKVALLDISSDVSLTEVGALQFALTGVAVSPNGKLIGAGDVSGGVTLWAITDKKSEELIKIKNSPPENPGDINAPGSPHSLAFSPDGKLIFSGLHNGTLRSLDANTGTEVQQNQFLNAHVKKMAVSHNGQYLITQQDNNLLTGWDLWSGTALYQLQGEIMPGDPFSQDDSMFAVASAASSPATVNLYNPLNGKEIQIFKSYPDLQTIQFIKDDAQLVTVYDKANIHLWSMASKQELETSIGFEVTGCLTFLDLNKSPIVSVTTSYYHVVADDLNRPGLCIFETQKWTFSIDETNGLIAYGGGEKLAVVNIQNANREDLKMEGVSLKDVIVSVALSPKGDLVAAAYDDNTIHIWDVAAQDQLTNFSGLYGHNNSITGLRFTPDGKLLISTSLDGTIRLWGVP